MPLIILFILVFPYWTLMANRIDDLNIILSVFTFCWVFVYIAYSLNKNKKSSLLVSLHEQFKTLESAYEHLLKQGSHDLNRFEVIRYLDFVGMLSVLYKRKAVSLHEIQAAFGARVLAITSDPWVRVTFLNDGDQKRYYKDVNDLHIALMGPISAESKSSRIIKIRNLFR